VQRIKRILRIAVKYAIITKRGGYMTLKEFEKIMEEDGYEDYDSKESRIFRGIKIIEKYLPEVGIVSAEHDQIWLDVDIEKLLEAGFTETEAIVLRQLGWMLDEEALSHFV
jgi:hypothetical protein